MLRINWNFIKALILVALLVFLYGFSHHKNSEKKVRAIDVEFEEGNNLFMNYEMVNKLLIQNGKTVKNQAKSVIDLHKLEAQVLAHPMVEDASIFLTVDGLLKSKIRQRTPIARVITDNESYYVDKQGKTMPLSANYSARVMLISGNVNKENSKEIHLLVTSILKDEFLKKQIISIHKMPNNEYVLRTRIGNQEIFIGNVENLNQKFENLKSFYTKSMTDNTIDNFTAINLKYNDQVVCTKR